MLGFAAFPMPAVFPSHYWVFHSFWHLFLAAGTGPHTCVANLLPVHDSVDSDRESQYSAKLSLLWD